MKRQLEFFAADAMAWRAARQPGTEEKVLSRDADDPAVLTRLVRWVPGLDTSGVGVITHDYVEEVYLLEGELTDLTLGRTFRAGHYASRRPGMPHGPYRTPAGCTMLEIRYRVTADAVCDKPAARAPESRDTELCPLPRWRPPRPPALPTA